MAIEVAFAFLESLSAIIYDIEKKSEMWGYTTIRHAYVR